MDSRKRLAERLRYWDGRLARQRFDPEITIVLRICFVCRYTQTAFLVFVFWHVLPGTSTEVTTRPSTDRRRQLGTLDGDLLQKQILQYLGRVQIVGSVFPVKVMFP